MDQVFIILDKMDKIGFEGVEKELLEAGHQKESVDRYLDMLKNVTKDAAGVRALGEMLGEVMPLEVSENLAHIMDTVQGSAVAKLPRWPKPSSGWNSTPPWYAGCPITQEPLSRYPWKGSAARLQAADGMIR